MKLDADQCHLVANAVLLFGIGWLELFFVQVAAETTLTALSSGDPATAKGLADVIGHSLPPAAIGALGLVQAAWAFLNALGLALGWRWAPRSAFGQWITLGLCGCVPFAAYGLWSLSRPYFWQGKRPPGE